MGSILSTQKEEGPVYFNDVIVKCFCGESMNGGEMSKHYKKRHPGMDHKFQSCILHAWMGEGCSHTLPIYFYAHGKGEPVLFGSQDITEFQTLTSPTQQESHKSKNRTKQSHIA